MSSQQEWRFCLLAKSKSLHPVSCGAQTTPPPIICEIPADGALDPAFESLLGPPSKLGFKLCRVDGVAAITPGAIRHELDLPVMALGSGWKTIKQVADRPDHFQIRPLVAAADIVGFADPAFLRRPSAGPARDRLHKANHEKPITNVLTIAIDRQAHAVDAVENRKRDQLFRQMEGPVVIRAIRDQNGQAVGVPPRPHEMIEAALLAEYGERGS